MFAKLIQNMKFPRPINQYAAAIIECAEKISILTGEDPMEIIKLADERAQTLPVTLLDVIQDWYSSIHAEYGKNGSVTNVSERMRLGR